MRDRLAGWPERYPARGEIAGPQRVGHIEMSDRQAAQTGEVRSAAQSFPDVARYRTDVDPAPDLRANLEVRPVARNQLEPVHVDRPGFQLEGLPLPGAPIGPTPRDALGRKPRRALGRMADQRGHRVRDWGVADRPPRFGSLEWLTG